MIPDRTHWSRALLGTFIMLDLFLWAQIIFAHGARGAYLFAALNVGQGDATLLRMPSGATFLTDAGPDASAARALDAILPAAERAIDIAVITHAQADHYGGFLEVLRRYRIGAILWSGVEPEGRSASWEALRAEIDARKIPLITVDAGDRILHDDLSIAILSPDSMWRGSGEPNDTGIVQGVVTPAWTALLTADIGGALEDELRGRFDLRADILKVGHHGSKYSSSEEFIKAVAPKIATVSVGGGNRYGHPAPATLARLESATGTSSVFRTDLEGTIRVVGVPGAPLRVSVERGRSPEAPAP